MKPDRELFRQLSERFSLVRLLGKDPSKAEGKDWTRYCTEKRNFDQIRFEPGENAGIACGPASGVLAVDVDNPELFESFCIRHGWNMAVTRTHRSRKGYHALYRYPAGGKYGCKAKPVLGIDIKGDGGQVVAPGSIHPESGQPYTILDERDPADVPRCIIDLFRKDPPEWSKVDVDKLKISDSTKRYIKEGAAKGDRSEAMMTVITALAGAGLSDDQIYYVFYTYPIGGKFKDIRKDRDGWLQKQIDKARLYVRAHPATPARELKMPDGFTAAELVRMDFPEPIWVVPGIIPEGLTILAGKPKLGKSWLSLGLALSVASGGKALGQIAVDRAEVLYLALEDGPRRLKKRLLSCLCGGTAPDNLHIKTEWAKTDLGGLTLLNQWIGEHKDTRLVIIDTLAKIYPRSQSKNDTGTLYNQESDLIGSLKAVADAHNLALVLVTHTRKAATEDPFDQISGSTGQSGSADTNLILRRTRAQADATLLCTSRDFEECELALKFDKESTAWRLLGQALDYNRSTEQMEIVGILRDAEEPIPLSEVVTLSGKKKRSVLYLLKTLQKDGIIEKVARGKYTLSEKNISIALPAPSAPVALVAPFALSGEVVQSTPHEAPLVQPGAVLPCTFQTEHQCGSNGQSAISASGAITCSKCNLFDGRWCRSKAGTWNGQRGQTPDTKHSCNYYQQRLEVS